MSVAVVCAAPSESITTSSDQSNLHACRCNNKVSATQARQMTSVIFSI